MALFLLSITAKFLGWKGAGMKARRVFLSCVIFFSFTLCFSAHSQELYRWADTDGNVHYTTRFERIPKQYRDQVLKQRTRKNVQKPP
ncbi:MAG: DUF4124 domain-containing protein, partial [candidate division Zixibacteria bacterium]|nr:DUF4124 domain-containing protein [candidate division Zixibacteria bacterium]